MADYYRHFKGGKYKLLGIAKDSETLEEMFFGTVERDGKVMQRFTKITEEEAL
jgi:hypothetical protein